MNVYGVEGKVTECAPSGSSLCSNTCKSADATAVSPTCKVVFHWYVILIPQMEYMSKIVNVKQKV
jgi:hypothetical protein